MSSPRYNDSFRHYSGRDLPGRAGPGGALNQLGAMKTGVMTLHPFLTPSRASSHPFEGVELLSPR